MLVLIVATGATVRLTGSGLGCEHWPGCAQHHFEPKSYHSYIEFSNRIVATLTVLATFVLGLGAQLTPTLTRRVKVLAWVVFVGTLAQAPLGAITVHYHLDPWLVITHLLLSPKREFEADRAAALHHHLADPGIAADLRAEAARG